MSWNRIEGVEAVKKIWGELTDDELKQTARKRNMLLGKIQEKYGIAQYEAEKRTKDLKKSLD
jgi:uncharacterized protein YjbJ (UPF0337 family)